MQSYAMFYMLPRRFECESRLLLFNSEHANSAFQVQRKNLIFCVNHKRLLFGHIVKLVMKWSAELSVFRAWIENRTPAVKLLLGSPRFVHENLNLSWCSKLQESILSTLWNCNEIVVCWIICVQQNSRISPLCVFCQLLWSVQTHCQTLLSDPFWSVHKKIALQVYCHWRIQILVFYHITMSCWCKHLYMAFIPIKSHMFVIY